MLTLKVELSPEILEKIQKMNSTAVEMFEGSMESLFRQDYNRAKQSSQASKKSIV